MPFHRRLHPFHDHGVRKIRADDILPKLLLLQELEHFEGRSRKREVLQVRRARPVLQIIEVRDEGRIRQKLAGCEVVEILWVRQGLDKLLVCQLSGGWK